MIPTPDGPYVGPRPFARGEDQLFFGRETEASDLIALIVAHPVVLFYAQSGAGKTSLLNARVVPQLEKRGIQVFSGTRVGGQLSPQLELVSIRNIFTFNALLSVRESGSEATPNDTLAAYFAQIANLGSASAAARRVIIFDQFEELFTTYAERWADREGFFEDVATALESDQRLRAVFAMREEYLARLDPYADLLPEGMRTRFRLERLRGTAALIAVKKPLESTSRQFAPGAAEKLVESLLQVPSSSAKGSMIVGEFVEPVHLQVVCHRLWKSLPDNVDIIREDYIEDFGDVNEALASYYDDCIRRVAGAVDVKEGVLRTWFDKKLITSDGTRGLVFQDLKATAGLSNHVVDELERVHLIRPEVRGSGVWYELTHDRLVAPIRKSNEVWRSERERGSLNARDLEGQAEEWIKGGRPDAGLLAEEDLAMAAAWLGSPSSEELGASDGLREFIQASKAVVERRRAQEQAGIASNLRRQRAALGVALVLFVVMLIMAYIAYSARRRESNAMRKVVDAALIERGKIAREQAHKPGQEFDALMHGVQAVDQSVTKDDIMPPEAVAGLREALTTVESSHWIRPKDDFEVFKLSGDGQRVLTAGKHGISVWELSTGRLVAATGDFEAPRSRAPIGAVEGSHTFGARISENGSRLLIQRDRPPRDEEEASRLTSTRHQYFEVEGGKLKEKFREELESADDAALVDNDTRLYIRSREQGAHTGTLRIIRLGSKEEPFVLPASDVELVSKDGDLLGVLRTSGEFEIWDLGKRLVLSRVRLPRAKGNPFLKGVGFMAIHLIGEEGAFCAVEVRAGEAMLEYRTNGSKEAVWATALGDWRDLRGWDFSASKVVVRTGTELRTYRLEDGNLLKSAKVSVAYMNASDDERLLTVDREGDSEVAIVRDLSTWKERSRRILRTAPPDEGGGLARRTYSGSDDLRYLGVSTAEREVQIFDLLSKVPDLRAEKVASLRSRACKRLSLKPEPEFKEVSKLCGK